MPLKIKDNVDLKELEKYGFYTYDDNCDYIINEDACLQIYDGDLQSDEYLQIQMRYYFTNDDNFNNAMDVIFDLIQAGLVEKVEDKQWQ